AALGAERDEGLLIIDHAAVNDHKLRLEIMDQLEQPKVIHDVIKNSKAQHDVKLLATLEQTRHRIEYIADQKLDAFAQIVPSKQVFALFDQLRPCLNAGHVRSAERKCRVRPAPVVRSEVEHADAREIRLEGFHEDFEAGVKAIEIGRPIVNPLFRAETIFIAEDR